MIIEDTMGQSVAEELIELAGEVIGGVAEAAMEIGVAATTSGGPGGRRGCRRFFLWFLLACLVTGVFAYFYFNGATS